jgi:DNA mismatch repair protein MutS
MHAGFSAFTPNDLALAPGERSAIILTGPNMSGKSTYLRQTALIMLMAQIGSFVPAESARLPIVDRVFARIGARDELASGQSTFMVEMTEAAHILHHATANSLVILDEIGRGTSTYDGLAIAWAIAEHLAQVGAMTLFATQYHQLNSLAESLPNVANFRVSVREEGDRVIWLHKVLEGGTDRSYGIQVARMAGVPRTVLDRAGEVLADLQGKEAPIGRVKPAALQMTLRREAGAAPGAVEQLRWGESFCEAYETFASLFEHPQISFEHACHLLRSLEKQNEICLDDCEGCGSLLVVMRYAERPKVCEFCASSRPPARPGLSVGDC